MNPKPLRSVLYIDDDPDIRHIVQVALGLSPDLSVHMAESGLQGLELARTLHPDLVLLDVMMPGIDGPTTLARLRADPQVAHIPVIFMTAKAMPQEVARFRAMGAAGVIPKPFDPMTLAAQLLAMWRSLPEASVADE